jgi:NAD(P)-dependent dehydrogenase (short-subunit alcohol dehydrogenase family)
MTAEEADVSAPLAEGRKAIVTGAASGIGRAVARRLVAEGARVALLDVDRQGLDAAAKQLGEAAIKAPADVRSPAEVGEAVRRARDEFGGLDTLVACAGIIHVKRLADVTEQDWDRTLDINLKGAFLCCQAAAPSLTESGRGRIVIISSDAGRRGATLLHAYSASKFGLIGLAEALAGELAPAATVNCVCPVGVPTTGMGQQLLEWKSSRTGRAPDEVLAGIARDLPMGRNATEADIANAVLFFVSEAASFITGVALDVDGGASLDVVPGVGRDPDQATTG